MLGPYFSVSRGGVGFTLGRGLLCNCSPRTDQDLVNAPASVISTIFNELRKTDPGATRANAIQNFHDLSELGRAELIDAAKSKRAKSKRSSPPQAPQPLPQSNWSPSDGSWLVREDIILKSAGGRGLASWGADVKKQLRGRMISQDQGLIPAGHKFLPQVRMLRATPGSWLHQG